MSRSLLKYARLTRQKLILFALVSAVLNGMVTAGVGAYLAQTYATYQGRRQAIEAIAHLIYERRTRAGMLASAIRRDADLDEVRHRKQAYDEAYVDWNKNVMLHLFAIREVAGDLKFSVLEPVFENNLIATMADVDRCVTKAYDKKLANADAKAVLVQCNMPILHQFVLDCGATFTNELYKLTQLTFIPLTGEFDRTKKLAEERINKGCKLPEFPKAPQPLAVPQASETPAAVSGPTAPVDPVGAPAAPSVDGPAQVPSPVQ